MSDFELLADEAVCVEWLGEPAARPAASRAGCAPLSVATLNVLFNVSERLQGGAQRYAHQCELLAQLARTRPLIVGLQEVTGAFVAAARASAALRARGVFLVTLPDVLAHSSGHGFGARGRHAVALLASVEPQSVRVVRLAGFARPAITVDFACGGAEADAAAAFVLRVAVVHTKPWRGDEHVALRRRQISALLGALHQEQQRTECHACVAVGDFNLYDAEEDVCIPSEQWVDVWPSLHGAAEPGFTFDTARNKMVQQLMPGKTDRLRLDRIVLLRASNLRAERIELFADEPVDADAAAAADAQASAKRGGFVSRTISWGRNFADPNRYLFPSDHFGIHCVLHPADQALASAANA